MAHSQLDDDPLKTPLANALARQRWQGLLSPAAPGLRLEDDGEDALENQPDPSQIWVDETVGPVRSDASNRDEPVDEGAIWQRALGFGREHMVVVVVALVVGLVFAAVTFWRTRPYDVPIVSASGLVVVDDSATPSRTSVRQIKVHVLGAVVNPGVVSLPDGARVEDAIAAAGGLTDQADPADLNLAAFVSDGAQIVIGTKTSPAGQVNNGGGSGSSQTGCVNLNTATNAQLQTLPGVGPVTAQKIIDWRDAHGRFSAIAELQEVDGIGPKTMAQLEPHVCI